MKIKLSHVTNSSSSAFFLSKGSKLKTTVDVMLWFVREFFTSEKSYNIHDVVRDKKVSSFLESMKKRKLNDPLLFDVDWDPGYLCVFKWIDNKIVVVSPPSLTQNFSDYSATTWLKTEYDLCKKSPEYIIKLKLLNIETLKKEDVPFKHWAEEVLEDRG